MTWARVWGVAGLCLTAAIGCTPEQSLPVEQPPAEVPPVVLVPPEKAPAPPAAPKSYWPLTAGTSWTYRITDPNRGVFEKAVTVIGPNAVPESNMTAILVRSAQPHLEEISWQVDMNGLVTRVREEDRKDGALARVTTWAPSTLKALSAAQAQGWSVSVSAHEVERLADGTVNAEKDKVYVWKVVEAEVEVSTPAGTFKAMKVSRERPDKSDYLRTYWLVPGVGKVREEGERVEELLQYDVR
ncbi:MAG: hypothetical protein HYZ28_27585 [Myxococcales bacterium]|nr:hypothetical protein [Myxococcales bacterium]